MVTVENSPPQKTTTSTKRMAVAGALTPQDLAHYSTFGFVILRNVFATHELATPDAEFERKLDDVYSHRPFDGSERHWSGACTGDDTPFLRDLTEDPRFLGTAQQLHGEDVFLAGVDANRSELPT